MKIMQFMPEFGLAGAEKMCEALCLELKKISFEVIVVSLYNYHSSITENLEKNGIKVIYLNKHRGFDFLMYKKIVALIKNEKPDVIHTHRYLCKYVIPSKILANSKAKTFHTVHNMADKEDNSKRLQRFFYHFLNLIPVAISPNVKKSIESYYHINLNKIPLIYNGINMKSCFEKQNFDIKNQVTFLHIGRFSEQKNHKNLLLAYDKFYSVNSNSRLLLVGTGELEEKIKNLASSLKSKDNIVFCGVTDDVNQYFEKADIFILPSIYEGMPITLIEAMSAGMPIIASNVGGIPDIIKNNVSGLLCTESINDIFEAMVKVSNDKVMREKLGREARKESEKYSSSIMAEKYAELYESGKI